MAPSLSSPLVVREIQAKSILSKSEVYDYALNAYVGCQHACRYCYARFMKRFTGHTEPWGSFVDVKVNAPELLAREVLRKRRGRVWISGVCDAYQPLEAKHALTRRCLEILVEHGWPLTVQTKSPLVLRDLDILKRAAAPPVAKRIEALGVLHDAGIRTFVMVAPLLPGAEGLAGLLRGKVDHALVDRYNYHYADRTYQEHGLQWAMRDDFFEARGGELAAAFERVGIPCQKLY